MSDDMAVESPEDERVRTFWDIARAQARLNAVPAYFGPNALDSVPPPAWSFGATDAQADELLALVLTGAKTATAGALWDYEAEGEALPSRGALAIVVDGSGRPRALIETTSVEIVPFDEVSAEHARLEGEGDLSLEHWREVHERFFTQNATHDRGFARDMPVVLERFRVLYAD